MINIIYVDISDLSIHSYCGILLFLLPKKIQVDISDLSIHSDIGRKVLPCYIVYPYMRDRKVVFTMEKNSSFTGNVDRAIVLSRWEEVGHLTTEHPTKVATHDGATLFTVKVGVIVDTNFPTKAGNTTTAVILVPLDGGKDFHIDGATLKFNGVSPFIYQGRGTAQVFTVLNDAGDVVKRHNGRKSTASEIEELKKQLADIAALLAKK